ncbi:MAG: hypothetical protein A2X22_02695 [Bacteroidetes bacterium GWF2_49_14]|nr:MAG: hypothetical protein A2X22_02695 [Bacteroidetes bacterium GWF2_49_14]
MILFSAGPVPAQLRPAAGDTTTVNRKILTRAIVSESAFYIGGMSYLNYIWYKDHERVPFEFYNDNKGYLQIDKFGHAFGAYMESYIGYQWLRHAGVKKNPALIFGGTLGILLQAPIEIFDGMYEGWGFSWGDIIANTAGSAFLIGQELLFNEQLIKYKFSYWKSPYLDMANGYLGNNAFEGLFYDYNGHNYWLSMPVNRIIPVSRIPDWLNVAVGYSANGMFGEFENIRYYHGAWIPETERYRQFLLSLDIDWTKIRTNSRFLKKILNAMVFIKLPFPAIEFNTLGKVRGHLMYW